MAKNQILQRVLDEARKASGKVADTTMHSSYVSGVFEEAPAVESIPSVEADQKSISN